MDLEPVWSAREPGIEVPKLDRDLETDVLIIGAGITGLTAAYRLVSSGKKVVVIDKSGVGSGDTACTSAHLSAILDTDYTKLAAFHGRKAAQLACESHRFAIDFIESVSVQRKIDCQFKRVDGYLFTDGMPTKKNGLHPEWRMIRDIGIEAQYVDNTPQRGLHGPALLVPRQARFHPMKYLNGLARVFLELGGEIFGSTGFAKLEEGGVLTDNGHHIRSKQTVFATHSPLEGTMIFLKEYAYRSYVIAARIPRNSVSDALYWDHEHPYHYVRVQSYDSAHDLLIVGGEDHKTGQAPSDPELPFRALEQWAAKRFPLQDVRYRWSGQVLETMDGLAYIGRIPYRHGRLYMATGYSGNGLTYGTIAGTLISDLVMEKKNPWSDLYDPARKNVPALKRFVEENFQAAKEMARSIWPAAGVLHSAERLAPGQGGVVREEKTAYYRDEKGNLSACSAVCTHMGCLVKWNSSEKTFDCPCHGARYSTSGEVLNGPAIHDLEKKEIHSHI